ncbi:MAG TPA: 50S ribosomal protein L24 [Candidatus Pacearchaeota archaeon]|jgi:large subunit ribosomal protein L24|nr:50S ribosomal protein L24 [Candidatus Pacearchaeota archaeon]HRR94537.1 50S ribosomal protein L24 [Candidatus Paceibacterota bacterium]HPC30402.1 50S ribosomal protein L24 [Candidatus Pacearchaeota archaeon]HQG09104.1 50S ribosomal protein L24 [Candidatus Pacearchaeota archaeon]HQH20088.1 50S ribosomal protein L24 [Candidatus Pacearchaeota archaeon]
MKIKKNDQVLIISGDDKGKKGKVLKVSSKNGKILVEGVNLVKKHIKPKKSGQKGQVVAVPNFLSVSKVKILCPNCGKGSRVGYEVKEKTKNRICKKCGQKI